MVSAATVLNLVRPLPRVLYYASGGGTYRNHHHHRALALMLRCSYSNKPSSPSSSAHRQQQRLKTRGASSQPSAFVPLRRSSSTTTTPSAHVGDPGSIDSPLMHSMEKKIAEQLNAESVTVKDAYGDGRHVCISVISSAFEGESAVNRQRMVYKAIWEELQSTVHAVDQMSTRTPAEAATEK